MSNAPNGWAETCIDDIAEVNPGRLGHIAADAQISFIPMPAVSDIEGEIVSPTIRPYDEVSKGYTQFRDGDVIFAKITPCMENGKIAVARELEGGVACGSTEFHVVRPLGDISPDFLWRYLRQKSFRIDAEASMTGAVGQRRVPANFLKEHRLSLPPLPEQRRIVAKIDSLTGKSRRARDHLNHIPRLVDKYKQAILAVAFSKAQSFVECCTPLGEIAAEVRNGLGKKPTEGPQGTPILRISSVRPCQVRLSEMRYYQDDVPAAAFLREGDLLFTRYNGNSEYTAVCGRVRDLKHEITYPDKLIRVRMTADVDSAFAELMCSSPQARQWLAPHIKSAAGQHGISGGDLKRLPIPIPTPVQQTEVVRQVHSAFAWVDRLTADATSARKLIDHLDQSVLAKAFKGELVPQDSADEPASTLLERIRTERATAPKAKRGRKKAA